MTLAAVGSCTPAVAQPVIATPVAGSGSNLESILQQMLASGGGSGGGGGSNGAGAGAPPQQQPPSMIVNWRGAADGSSAPPPQLPADWRPLAKAGLRSIYGIFIRGGPKDQLLGMLNIGFSMPIDKDVKVGLEVEGFWGWVGFGSGEQAGMQ